MKIKVAIASLAVATVVVAAFAFTTKKAPTKHYYISGTQYQRLEPGITTGAFVERSLQSSVFQNTGNWTTTPQAFNVTSDMSKYIGSISFELDVNTNGGSDGKLTLQEALNAVYAQYSAPTPDVMQNSYTVDGNAIVTIEAADAAH